MWGSLASPDSNLLLARSIFRGFTFFRRTCRDPCALNRSHFGSSGLLLAFFLACLQVPGEQWLRVADDLEFVEAGTVFFVTLAGY